MTDEKPVAPPTFAPRSAAPRPDGARQDAPPPPPASVATDVREELDDTTVRRPESGSPGPGASSGSALDAMKKAARKVTAVVTGDADTHSPTGATPVVQPAGARATSSPEPTPQLRTTAYLPYTGTGQQQPGAPVSQPTSAYPVGAAQGAAAGPQTMPGRPGGAQGLPGAQPAADPRAQAAVATPPTTLHGGAPRRVRLVVSRVNPWSVMKMAFLLSIALGIITVVAAAVVWSVLNGMHLFSSINDLVEKIVGNETQVNILQYVAFSRTMSMATLVSVVNIILMTALATLGAFLYNIASSLVGGVHVTLTDD